jgi:hypothetical protein
LPHMFHRPQRLFIFEKHIMTLIASYYVHLHVPQSPRVQAIHNMNSLLNLKYALALCQSDISQLPFIYEWGCLCHEAL